MKRLAAQDATDSNTVRLVMARLLRLVSLQCGIVICGGSPE